MLSVLQVAALAAGTLASNVLPAAKLSLSHCTAAATVNSVAVMQGSPAARLFAVTERVLPF
jgi:hypothetical protein